MCIRDSLKAHLIQSTVEIPDHYLECHIYESTQESPEHFLIRASMSGLAASLADPIPFAYTIHPGRKHQIYTSGPTGISTIYCNWRARCTKELIQCPELLALITIPGPGHKRFGMPFDYKNRRRAVGCIEFLPLWR